MDKSTPFEVLISHLENLRFHHLITLDQLQSEKYLTDCRNHLFNYCYWREIIGFKNYVTLEFSKELKKLPVQEEMFKDIYFTNKFVIPYNNSFTNLECLVIIKTILESITNEFLENGDYDLQKSFKDVPYVKYQSIPFLKFSDHTFSFNKIPSPLYQLLQHDKVKKSIKEAFKEDFHRFYQNVKVTTNSLSFEKETDYILKNIEFYNSLFYYGRIISFMPTNDLIKKHYFNLIIEDTFTYTKKLAFLNEDYTKAHRKHLKDTFSFYKNLINETSEKKAYNLVKMGYQLSQCYIRLKIILIQLTLIRFFKFSLINYPNLKIGSIFEYLNGENQFVYFNNEKISLDSFNDFSYSSVKRNKKILETVLKEEKARFTQLFNDLMNET